MKQNTQKIDQLLRKKFFVLPSSSVYGSQSGLYDFGPSGTLLKNNIISVWRKLFIKQNVFEIEPCILTPYDVLKASGHVHKFCDLLVFDLVNGECYRADHFIEKRVEEMIVEIDNNMNIKNDSKIDDSTNDSTNDGKIDVKTNDSKINEMFDNRKQELLDIINNLEKCSPKDVDEICDKYNLKSDNGNSVGNCKHFNLMFQTTIGPKSSNVAYLRPETAQGQFVNFKKLYELNNGKLPFASACIGKVFRNEISPRSGLLRVREFEQAEIEYFTYPDEKFRADFSEVEHILTNFLYVPTKTCTTKDIQEDKTIKITKDECCNIQKIKKMSIREALDEKIIDNEVIAYYIGKTYKFLMEIGINMHKVRFRQHKKDEMAHYANDCWDAEIETSFGWIECVGIADRGCFDLQMHQKHSNKDFTAKRTLKEPIEKEVYNLTYNKKEVALKLKDKMKEFTEMLNNLTINEIESKIAEENSDGMFHVTYMNEKYKITAKNEKIKIHVEDILPHVIEPSFGIGRILYSLIEHVFYTRECDPDRHVLRFNSCVSPYKCVVTTLMKGKEYESIISYLKNSFGAYNIEFILCDRSVSIGKKYASYDEIGANYFITIDGESKCDNKCTIRERDTMQQIRVKIRNVGKIVKKLCKGKKSWIDYAKYRV
ncbi:Glycine--tRNA ligase 1 [Binucleata daphniae]